MRTDKIYLVGFMGAGKTTLATALGARLQWRVEDLDTVIERREKMSVTDLFATHGESRFRTAEQTALRALLPIRQVVVSTGGGAFASAQSRTLINRDGVSFWLDVSLQLVGARLSSEDGRRPLAADKATMERLFHARQSDYRQAHVRLDAEHATAGELVERIVDWLERQPAS
ncbi:MAG: shikimate kinase [bacterium]